MTKLNANSWAHLSNGQTAAARPLLAIALAASLAGCEIGPDGRHEFTASQVNAAQQTAGYVSMSGGSMSGAFAATPFSVPIPSLDYQQNPDGSVLVSTPSGPITVSVLDGATAQVVWGGATATVAFGDGLAWIGADREPSPATQGLEDALGTAAGDVAGVALSIDCMAIIAQGTCLFHGGVDMESLAVFDVYDLHGGGFCPFTCNDGYDPRVAEGLSDGSSGSYGAGAGTGDPGTSNPASGFWGGEGPGSSGSGSSGSESSGSGSSGGGSGSSGGGSEPCTENACASSSTLSWCNGGSYQQLDCYGSGVCNPGDTPTGCAYFDAQGSVPAGDYCGCLPPSGSGSSSSGSGSSSSGSGSSSSGGGSSICGLSATTGNSACDACLATLPACCDALQGCLGDSYCTACMNDPSGPVCSSEDNFLFLKADCNTSSPTCAGACS